MTTSKTTSYADLPSVCWKTKMQTPPLVAQYLSPRQPVADLLEKCRKLTSSLNGEDEHGGVSGLVTEEI